MLENQSYKPSAFLSKYIDRFYVFEKVSVNYFDLPAVLPGTGLELLFHLDKPLQVNDKVLPKAHTVCPRKLFCFDKEKKVSFLSVRFKSGAFRHFNPVPFAQLNDTYYSLINLWGQKGSNLLQKIDLLKTINQKINEIELFLHDAFTCYHKIKNDKWDVVIDDLYYNFKSITIHEIAKKSNLSMRQFERGFKAQFGITPKMFQKISRFQSVVKQLLLNQNSRYFDLIIDSGYFDQSHFINEFKALTGQTPLTYFCSKNFRTHFYHNSGINAL